MDDLFDVSINKEVFALSKKNAIEKSGFFYDVFNNPDSQEYQTIEEGLPLIIDLPCNTLKLNRRNKNISLNSNEKVINSSKTFINLMKEIFGPDSSPSQLTEDKTKKSFRIREDIDACERIETGNELYCSILFSYRIDSQPMLDATLNCALQTNNPEITLDASISLSKNQYKDSFENIITQLLEYTYKNIFKTIQENKQNKSFQIGLGIGTLYNLFLQMNDDNDESAVGVGG